MPEFESPSHSTSVSIRIFRLFSNLAEFGFCEKISAERHERGALPGKHSNLISAWSSCSSRVIIVEKILENRCRVFVRGVIATTATTTIATTTTTATTLDPLKRIIENPFFSGLPHNYPFLLSPCHYNRLLPIGLSPLMFDCLLSFPQYVTL